jgi:hypothetical protein
MILIISILTIATYWGTWHGYFQQDEWSGFARVISAQEEGFRSLIRFSGSHFTPLSIVHVAILYAIFELHHTWYGVYSVFLHLINTCLLFILAQAMTKNKIASLLSAIVFAIAFTPQQAVTWYAASMAYLPGAFFALLGLIVFEKFLQFRKKSYLWLAIMCACISAGFRETGIALLPYFAYRDRPIWKPIALTLIGYVALRFGPLAFTTSLTTSAPHATEFFLTDILYQKVTFILFYLPRFIIPIDIPIAIAQFVFGSTFRLAYDSILNIFYAITWATFLLCATRIPWTTHMKNAVLLVLLSLAPLTLLPRPFVMESRHFYPLSMGFALLVGHVVYQYIHKKVVIIFFLAIVALNVALIRQEMSTIQSITTTRLSIISQWFSLYPTIPNNTVFLVLGDVPPFQSGFGQMLLVYYKATPFLKNYFLWNIYEQGYRQSTEGGFGYFTEHNRMMEAYCEHKIKSTDVFIASWDQSTASLTDISSSYRATLACPHN